jgi:hypothetical protein
VAAVVGAMLLVVGLAAGGLLAAGRQAAAVARGN